nr:MFS transporter [Maliibacterium massiliense]
METQPQNAWTRARRILPMILLFSSALMSGIINGLRGVCLPLIKADFGIGYDSQGFMLFLTMASSLLFTTLSNIVIDKTGIKRNVTIGFLALFISVMLMIWAPSYPLFLTFFTLINGMRYFNSVGQTAMSTVIFTTKVATKVGFVNGFFGIGSMIAPKLATWLMHGCGLGWRQLYLTIALPSLLLCVLAVLALFPQGRRVKQKKSLTIFGAFKMPVMWMFAITSGFGMTLENGFIDWSLLYLQDMYQIDPVVQGATFISIFYVLYAVSRLTNGILADRIGCVRLLKLFAGGMTALLAVCLCIGRPAVWAMPVCGIFAAPFWPMMVAAAIKSFGEDATPITSAGMMTACLINAFTSWVIGLTNRYIGPEWGFRSLVLYGVVLVALLFFFGRMLYKRHGYVDSPRNAAA